MFDIIKVLIGLLLPFLVLSLLCTLLTEFISRTRNLRGKTLANAIRVMLTDTSNAELSDVFYHHHLIRSLFQGKREPPYIPSRLFAYVLVDIIKSRTKTNQLTLALSKIQEKPLREALLALNTDTNTDRAVIGSIERWYNDVMERASGWYQQKVQTTIIVLGFSLAVGINIDTVLISDYITRGAVLREVFVATAKDLIEVRHQDAATQAVDKNRATELAEAWYQLQPFGLPIGWVHQPGQPFYYVRGTPTWPNEENFLTKLIGLFLTACAVILGAPMWFDVLNKFVLIRTSGKAPEETPLPPMDIPSPLEESRSPSSG
ncbi:MAG: hypothetical protein AABO57_26825 [Acidobacteriota bacterium]